MQLQSVGACRQYPKGLSREAVVQESLSSAAAQALRMVVIGYRLQSTATCALGTDACKALHHMAFGAEID